MAMRQFARPMVIASVVLCVFCLVIQAWVIAAVMALNATTMARIASRQKP
jgi:type IV secretory pathway TrbD component